MQKNNKSIAMIIKNIEGAASRGNMETIISGINIDSRMVRPGDLFVCVPGFNFDGHNFAEKAVEAGAVALLVEKNLPLDVPQIKVANVRATVGIIAAQMYDYPTQKINLTGVTGTNGKTTVTHLMESIAHESGENTGIIGTLGAKINSRELPGNHTTPESVDVQKLLSEMVGEKVQTAVMEVSSHALDLGRVNGCDFKAAVFTNLSQDHLDYHNDMEDYLRAKSLLFSNMKGQKPGQFSVLNADDKSYCFLKEKSACRVVTYGIETMDCDYRAEKIELSDRGVEFVVVSRTGNDKIVYGTPGRFSVYNALAAYVWGVECGYKHDIIVTALRDVYGVPGRFQSIRTGQPFQVIVDYAHTPDGLENVLSTASEITEKRLITVFGCGGDRDKKKRPLMAQAASRWSDYLVVTSDNPRTEDPDSIIADILPGIEKVDYEIIPDRRKAINIACAMAVKGDTIVVAGKGHEDYQILGTEKIHFDDREEVEKALRSNNYVE
ncbi:MAG: UDP-N-acetylmuramoyl-L-alanyl-D-glutamate--2,6-diaminopimelate ligase [Eubacteriales bacterium]